MCVLARGDSKMAGLPAQVMLTAMGILLVFVGTVQTEWNEEHKVMNYYMINLCGTTLNMADTSLNEAIIQLSNNETYGNNMDCELTIVTSEGQNLMFSFLDLSLQSCDDWVQLYSETTDPSDVLTPRLCTAPYDVPFTPRRTGIVKFRSNSLGDTGSLKVLVTSFYTTVSGKCKDGYFSCMRHDRCIHSDLKCNDRDNCGNERDEEECKEGDQNWWIYTVVFSVVPMVIVVGVVVTVSCILIHKKKKGMVGAPRPGQARYPTTSPPAYQNQAYSGTANTTNQSWFAPSTTNTDFSTMGPSVDPPLAAFSYNEQAYSNVQKQKM